MNDEANQVNQYAMIWNYNANVERQFNYYGEKLHSEQTESEDESTPSPLRFFSPVLFRSAEKRGKLIELLNDVTKQIDIDNGRDWFCIYAGYRYFKEELAVKGQYTDFFADIETLVPEKLKKIDTSKTNEARYHKYTQLMGREAQYWYMDNGMLPPQKEFTTWNVFFRGDQTRFAKHVLIINDVCKRLRSI